MLRYSFLPILLTIAVFSLPTTEVTAAKVKVWHHRTADDFADARLNDAVVSNEGVLRLARKMTSFADLNVAHIWDIAEDKRGNLWVATGGEVGKLIKVTPLGETKVAYTSSDSQVLCVEVANDGSVYAGTGPRGQLVRVTANGKSAKVIAKNLGSYVWSLAIFNEQNRIYVGTGPKGRIFQCSFHGKAKEFYRTGQEHILSLARDNNGQLIAGTDKGGLVYRIDANGKGFVLFKTQQSEVRSLVVTAQGIFAGTGSPTRKISPSATYSQNDAQDKRKSLDGSIKSSKTSQSNTADKVDLASTKSTTGASEEQEPPKADTVSAPESAETGENSLYRIGDDGSIREIFREKAMILSMLPEKDRFLLGTGTTGRIYEVNTNTQEKTELARLKQGQVHCLLRRSDGSIVVGTGAPGKLYILHKGHAQSGTILSDVLDAKIASRWGAPSWQVETPNGTMVTMAFRSGNVSVPDKTWSDWSEEQSDPDRAQVLCPTARYLQYRITMSSQNVQRTPQVYGLALRYSTTNQAPKVTKLSVPDLLSKEMNKPGKLKLSWKAVDPNEDGLLYSVFVRKTGWKNWIRIRSDLGKTSYDWDSTTMPSGQYQVKVVANDGPDNTTEETRESERISTPFPVSNEAPKVKVVCVGFQDGKAILEATSTDSLVRITNAGYSLNGGTWQTVFPKDGLSDSQREAYRFRTETLSSGNYVLVLRVRNAAGHTGTADVVFAVPGKK